MALIDFLSTTSLYVRLVPKPHRRTQLKSPRLVEYNSVFKIALIEATLIY